MEQEVVIQLKLNKESADYLNNMVCDGFYYDLEEYFEIILGNPSEVSTTNENTLMFFHDTYLESFIFKSYLDQLGHRTCILYAPIDDEDEDFENMYDKFIVLSTVSEMYPKLNSFEKLV